MCQMGQTLISFFKLTAGVRQGGVLSPKLFSIFVDDLSQKINSRDLGCHISLQCTSIFLYADDIVLVARQSTCFKKCSIVVKLN